MPSILVVDDDPDLCDTLCALLTESGYHAASVATGPALRRHIARYAVDLVILDIGLGREDGRELVLEIRKTSKLPIIMLSGRTAETDRVVGLELGADDYIAKPYRTAELLARIKAVLRRAGWQTVSPADAESPPADREAPATARFQDWRLDTARRRLTDPDGVPVPLTTGEYALLAAFIRHPGRVLSREQLLDFTGREETIDRSIDVQVMRLRRKIEQDPKDPLMIQAVRGAGYLFSPRVDWGP